MGISPESMSRVGHCIRQIEEIESKVRLACSRDSFTASADDTRVDKWFSEDEKSDFRHVAMCMFWRHIQEQIRALARYGIIVEGYSNRDAWIKSNLDLLPQPKPPEPTP